MKAAVVREFGAPLLVEDLVLDRPQRNEVRVRIGAVAVCGSDVHAIDGGWGGELPSVNGHEAAGVVVELGTGTSQVSVGDHVAVTLLRTCGDCPDCRRDEQHLCSGTFALAAESRLADDAGTRVAQGTGVGGFAEEVVVHESQAVPIPKQIPLDRACLLACGVITGYGAVANTASVAPGSSVVVLGSGGVGINCVQGARAAGADPIIVADLSDAKLALAKRLGATHTLVAGGTGLADEVHGLTGGRGADYVFVAVGRTEVVESGLTLLRRGATLVVVGMSAAGEHARIEMSQFAYTAPTVVGSRMGSTRAATDIPRLAAEHLAGRLRLDELISGRFPLSAINRAVEQVRSGDALRNVIVFDGVAP